MVGEIEGVEPGHNFQNRQALNNADVHRGLMRGISSDLHEPSRIIRKNFSQHLRLLLRGWLFWVITCNLLSAMS